MAGSKSRHRYANDSPRLKRWRGYQTKHPLGWTIYAKERVSTDAVYIDRDFKMVANGYAKTFRGVDPGPEGYKWWRASVRAMEDQDIASGYSHKKVSLPRQRGQRINNSDHKGERRPKFYMLPTGHGFDGHLYHPDCTTCNNCGRIRALKERMMQGLPISPIR